MSAAKISILQQASSSDFVRKVGSRADCSDPTTPTGNQNAPNFLLSRITHPCLPIVAFKLLWRPLFASLPSSICRFFRFTKYLSLNRLPPAYNCTSNTFQCAEQLSATFCTVFSYVHNFCLSVFPYMCESLILCKT